MKNVTIKIEAEALLKLIELGYGFEVIGNTHIPVVSKTFDNIEVPQFIQPYFKQPPVMNLPNYNNVNLGNVVVNYLREMKQNHQINANADAYHSNRTSGIYHDVLNYQYFDDMVNANWQFKINQNGILELHNPSTDGDYLSVQHGALFYHYLNRMTGKFVKIPIAEASGYINPSVTLLLDSAIQWSSNNPSAVLRFNLNDVTALIKSQYNAENSNAVVGTKPTTDEMFDARLVPTNEMFDGRLVPTKTVAAVAVPAETTPEVSPVPVPDVSEEVEAATGEPVSLDDKCKATIETVITIVEDYVNARKEKKRNTKLYTSQLSAISNAFEFAMLRLAATTDLSAIKQYEHKLNILKDELNCLNISIVSNIENPLYYVNTLLKYYK